MSIRRNEIHARRGRRLHLKKLRERYAKAKTHADKEKILTKVTRVAPGVTSEQFLATIKTS